MRLKVFISSTVEDLGPVRDQLRDWLDARGIEVIRSEDPEFPVPRGQHSHDVCLDNVESCHAVVLLIGTRLGGLYAGNKAELQGVKKSITRLEYEEALRHGIPVIPLVHRDVTEESKRLVRAQRAGQDAVPVYDARILEFVSEIRKARSDNWLEPNWDGTAASLFRVVESRLNALLASLQLQSRQYREQVRAFSRYAWARLDLDAAVASIGSRLRPGTPIDTRKDFAERLLDVIGAHRSALFGFQEDDLYNFALYKRHGQRLTVFARRAHPRITAHNRSWDVGQGQIGKAVETGRTLQDRGTA